MMRRSGIVILVGTIMAALLTAPAAAQTPKAVVVEAVSYTHLTLPTICSV